jgi:hypothetical protein
MKKTKLAIGLVSYGPQDPHFWLPFSRLCYDLGKSKRIQLVEVYHEESCRISTNRNKVARAFMAGEADWVWLLDTDTATSIDTLKELLNSREPFIGALCYSTKDGRTFPEAVIHTGLDFYEPADLSAGGTVTVDAVGTGCLLVHRKVFQKVLDSYSTYYSDGRFIPVLKERVSGEDVDTADTAPLANNGTMLLPAMKVPDGEEHQFPFFSGDYSAGEDYYFCKLARQVGFYPKVDTTLKIEQC